MQAALIMLTAELLRSVVRKKILVHDEKAHERNDAKKSDHHLPATGLSG